MRVSVHRLRERGWPIPKYQFAFRHTVAGELTLSEEWDEVLSRHTRVARLRSAGGETLGVPLLDAQLVKLTNERLVLSGGPIGLMQAALDIALPYVRERQQFDAPIGSFGIMQAKVADMYTALQSARAFTYRVAGQFDRGEPTRFDAAACLLLASKSAVEVALEAIQSLGGNGYINEYPTGRLLRDAKLYEIGAGTSEIRRMLIGRELFRATGGEA